MSREKRRKSKSGIYHIMLRGIDQRHIFIDDDDCTKFLKTLMKAKEAGGFSLYAYCLMDNHVHLLVKENEEIGTSIKRITVSYVQWHNNKYGRTGHLFQNRYTSEVVESEAYFLVVLRYIHQNPMKAMSLQTLWQYAWSSYNLYIDAYHGKSVAIETDITRQYFANKKSFETYMLQPNNDTCLDFNQKIKYTDKELIKLLKNRYALNEVSDLPKSDRDKIIAEIKKEADVSIRQLSRILGIGRGIIENAYKKTSS